MPKRRRAKSERLYSVLNAIKADAMTANYILDIVILLGAAVIAVPLFRLVGLVRFRAFSSLAFWSGHRAWR